MKLCDKIESTGPAVVLLNKGLVYDRATGCRLTDEFNHIFRFFMFNW